MIGSLSSYSSNIANALALVNDQRIDELYHHFLLTLESGNSIFLFGNGGSHANAHHIVGDYQKSLALLGFSARIFCPSDNCCYLTAASNDIDFSEAYSLTIGTIVRRDDFVIYLSGSGNSINLVKCATKCKELGIHQASITGFEGGAISNLTNISVHIPVNDMEVSEDCQIIIFHYLKQRLTQHIATCLGTKLYSDKYQRRISEGNVA